MIIGETFLWLHLPKTGGTSMNTLFRQRELPGVVIDPDDTASKHDSVDLRESRGGWRAGARKRFITARRLETWLVSDWQHKRRHMDLPNLDFEPVRCGLFYSLRLGGIWVAADWWLNYFAVDERVTALRLEHLEHDLNRWLLPLLPAGTPEFVKPPKANARPTTLDLHAPTLSSADRTRIAASNPRWSQWERRLYSEVSESARP